MAIIRFVYHVILILYIIWPVKTPFNYIVFFLRVQWDERLLATGMMVLLTGVIGSARPDRGWYIDESIDYGSSIYFLSKNILLSSISGNEWDIDLSVFSLSPWNARKIEWLFIPYSTSTNKTRVILITPLIKPPKRINPSDIENEPFKELQRKHPMVTITQTRDPYPWQACRRNGIISPLPFKSREGSWYKKV